MILAIDPISVPKAADVLAEKMREKILKGDFGVGMEFPSERDLSEQTGVSRATVREALRILEGEGLIEIRQGRKGGSSVVRPTTAQIERSVGIFIRGQRLRQDAVLETRCAIEPAAARYAAEHRTEEDLENLERCHQRVEEASRAADISAYIEANLDWHVQVVRASHNELLIAFISAVSNSVYVQNGTENFSSPKVRDEVMRAHRRVMDAIRDQDGDAAARRMGRHVQAYIDSVSQARAPHPPRPQPRQTRRKETR